jgi:hypothetical protein
VKIHVQAFNFSGTAGPEHVRDASDEMKVGQKAARDLLKTLKSLGPKDPAERAAQPAGQTSFQFTAPLMAQAMAQPMAMTPQMAQLAHWQAQQQAAGQSPANLQQNFVDFNNFTI